MIRPYLQDEALLENIQRTPTAETHFHLWWLGQSGFLIGWNGHFALFDPYLSDSLTRKYAQTDKPHIRMTERAIDPARLDFLEVVTSSHNHTDHLDAETLLPILQANPNTKLLIPEANRQFVADRLNCPPDLPVGINDGQSTTIGAFTFFGVPAAHNELERDEKGNCRYMGFVMAFGQWKIYHSGDTLWFDGMEELLRPFQVDVALLPINGNLPERRVAGNLNTQEAAALGKSIGAKVVIPCHYDMFTFNTANPQDFTREAQALGQASQVLHCGQSYAFPAS